MQLSFDTNKFLIDNINLSDVTIRVDSLNYEFDFKRLPLIDEMTFINELSRIREMRKKINESNFHAYHKDLYSIIKPIYIDNKEIGRVLEDYDHTILYEFACLFENEINKIQSIEELKFLFSYNGTDIEKVPVQAVSMYMIILKSQKLFGVDIIKKYNLNTLSFLLKLEMMDSAGEQANEHVSNLVAFSVAQHGGENEHYNNLANYSKGYFTENQQSTTTKSMSESDAMTEWGLAKKMRVLEEQVKAQNANLN